MVELFNGVPIMQSGELSTVASNTGLSGFNDPIIRVIGAGDNCPAVNASQTIPFSAYSTCGVQPLVNSDAATNVTSGSAQLNGSVNALGVTTTIDFEWGTSTSYGNTHTASPATLNTSVLTPVSTSLYGLDPSTVYHYRTKATYPNGTLFGNDQQFTTTSTSTGISTINSTGIKVYPNPAKGELHVTTPASESALLTLSNVLGEKVIRVYSDGPDALVDVSKLTPGMYILNISGNDFSVSTTVVIEK